MYRLALAALLASLVVSGCGSDSAPATKSEPKSASSPTASQTAEPSYFVAADTTAINKAADPMLKAGTKAQAEASIDRCNKFTEQGIAPYRRCLHALLDPFAAGLRGVATAFEALARRGFAESCATELGGAAQAFEDLATQVDQLMAGFDDDRRAAQVRSARTFQKKLDGVTQGYTKSFQALTQVCYSPQDLESINASPTPSPAPSP
jgi:hypothetical protein